MNEKAYSPVELAGQPESIEKTGVMPSAAGGHIELGSVSQKDSANRFEIGVIQDELAGIQPELGIGITSDRELLTPLRQVSHLSLDEWKIAHTTAFDAEHPEWKKLRELQPAYQEIGNKLYRMNVQYGEQIDLRNRALDQVRFKAVENGGRLYEGMVDEAFQSVGYDNPQLKAELLKAVQDAQMQPLAPEDSIPAHERVRAEETRSWAYLQKQWAALEMAKNMREIKKLEDGQSSLEHRINVESEILKEQKQEEHSKKEEETMKGILDIPLEQRGEVRQDFANRLRAVRGEAQEGLEKFDRDTEETREYHKNLTDQRIQNEMWDKERHERELAAAHQNLESVADVAKPTDEDREESSAFVLALRKEQANQAIKSFKAPVEFDERATEQEFDRLYAETQKIITETPYLSENGEPKREEVWAFREKYGI